MKDKNGVEHVGSYVADGDSITIKELNNDLQLMFVEYPTAAGKKTGWIDNSQALQYTYANQYQNGSTAENVLDASGNVVGSLNPREQATPLFRGDNGMLYIIYGTAKGPHTKAGYVKYNGGFSKF